MIINKITTGFVVQVFDTDKGQYILQEFIAGDQVDYEERVLGHEGNPLGAKEMAKFNFGPEAEKEPYLPFDMVQPIAKGEHVFNPDIGICIRCGCDEDDAYVGGQECTS
jgi:hypothetical protein